jgi:hypothetical protein
MLNTECIKKAAEELNIPFTILDDFGDFIRIDLDKPKYFIHAKTPYNSDSETYLVQDKEFSYRLYKDELKMPKTVGYVDPGVVGTFKDYLEFNSNNEIKKDIISKFSFPVIVKMNTGSMGRNVYLCKNESDIDRALSNIFDRERRHYDRVAIAQEYVDIKSEYRLIWFKGEIILAYEKLFEGEKDNQSPLHNEGAEANVVEDSELVDKFKNFLSNSKSLQSVEYTGVDVVVDKDGNMYLLELNNFPGFRFFIKYNGPEKIIELYKKLLTDLKNES